MTLVENRTTTLVSSILKRSPVFSGHCQDFIKSWRKKRAASLGLVSLQERLALSIPSKSLHFVHSSYSLTWLSQVDVYISNSYLSFVHINVIGLIEEEKLDSFNLPFYTPTAEEVKKVLEEQRCFTLQRQDTDNGLGHLHKTNGS
ncbi:hypothetical protein JRO89_XS02G0040800 [Xanthoceras sorbifolium]|uniref:Uncharacterized protein n=1 Tax=Xanthoceras sorbifolium TaxID=99658 RepID=A0ABQ8IFQ3_9ROSI|nr:hypothetical protein JRO89_XS02G0040800 [Xanthoceras sorbifolium]